MNGKFVFESFQEYIEKVLNEVETGTINEAEAVANLTAASSQVVGDLKLKGNEKSVAERFFDELSKYVGDLPALAKRINNDIKETFDMLTQKEKGVDINGPNLSSFDKTYVKGDYRYLYSNSVVAKGNPRLAAATGDLSGAREDKQNVTDLNSLLGAVNAYNIQKFRQNATAAAGAKSDRKAKVYSGTRPENSYLWLDDAGGRALEFTIKTPYTYMKSFSTLEVPLYSIDKFKAGRGNNIDEESVTTVVKPGGTSIEVVDKPHNSSGTDFFAENDVVISSEGLLALKALISQYNEIKTIKVNGSASSKPTSRAGGNEQLAKDRRSAGIKALEKLKSDGAEQLESAKIEEGTAKVQEGDPAESDAAFQQVSFSISGMAKASQIKNKEPETITKIENINADIVSFNQYMMKVYVRGDISNA